MGSWGWKYLAMVTMVVVVSSGCATTGSRGSDTQSLKNQVQALEEQNKLKDAEIESLRSALSRTTEERYLSAKQKVSGIDVPSVKDIQAALKNAGYDPGPVDGKMGTQTRRAIRSFQKANGLSADGKVGKKTWSLLEPYLTRT